MMNVKLNAAYYLSNNLIKLKERLFKDELVDKLNDDKLALMKR